MLKKFRTISTFAVSCFFIAIVLSGCGKNEQAMPETNHDGPGAIVKNYKTIDELSADAEEISEIKVLSQETIFYQEVPFTISTVSVLTSFKGNHKQGDTIRIIETGGEFTPIDKDRNPLPKQIMKFNGIPVLEKDEHDVIFLKKFAGPQMDGETYVPVGVYQGRFKFDSTGQLVQQAPNSDKLKDFATVKFDKFSEILEAKISDHLK